MTLGVVAVNVNKNLAFRSDKISSVNKIILIGNLGKDPEIRYTPQGTALCKFTLATSQKKKDGEDSTQWHKVTMFGKKAEVCGEHLKKGQKVYIEGRIEYGQYQDKEGNTRYTTDIIGYEMQFMTPKNATNSGGTPF